MGFRVGFWFGRQGFKHHPGSDVKGPFARVGGTTGGFADAAVVGGQGRADHGCVLGVEFDDDSYAVGVQPD